MTKNILGNKHGNKKQFNKSLWLIPLTMFISVSVVPNNALAFEAALSSSRSQKLIIDTRLANREDTPYTYTSTGIAISAPPVTTQAGDWHKVEFEQPRQVHMLPLSEDKPPQPQVISPPNSGVILVLEGEASYYSRAGCLGCSPTLTMANGQPLDDNALTMAIGANRKHLVGHTARVTNLHTGQSVMVRITDTGGFYQARYNNRVADLTVATKNAIGIRGGVGQVRVEVF